MFAVSPDCTNEPLLEYLALHPVASSKCSLERIPGKKKRKRMYTYKERPDDAVTKKPKGLTKFLRKTFYKHYKRKPGRFGNTSRPVKMASSKATGKRVDKEIFLKISGKKPRGKLAKRPLHPLTTAIFRYWTARGLTPVAAQVPVQMPELNVMTQADVIVEDRQGELWMHEIKTGYCGMRDVQGHFAAQFRNVPCTKGNQWDMQRHFTDVALCRRGLPLRGSRVINAYQQRFPDGIREIVKERKVVIKKL
jgi:hypothetical protein